MGHSKFIQLKTTNNYNGNIKIQTRSNMKKIETDVLNKNGRKIFIFFLRSNPSQLMDDDRGENLVDKQF